MRVVVPTGRNSKNAKSNFKMCMFIDLTERTAI